MIDSHKTLLNLLVTHLQLAHLLSLMVDPTQTMTHMLSRIDEVEYSRRIQTPLALR